MLQAEETSVLATIRMPNGNCENNVLVIDDSTSLTQIFRLTGEDCVALFNDLIVADTESRGPITLAVGGIDREFEYPTWQAMYGAVHNWFDIYMNQSEFLAEIDC